MKSLKSIYLIMTLLLSVLSHVAIAQSMSTELNVPGADPYCAAGAYPNLGAASGDAPPNCPRIGADTPLTMPKEASLAGEKNVVVDWILVELHAVAQGNDNKSTAAEADGSTVLARKPALLLRNGRIVDAEAFTDSPKTRTEIGLCMAVDAHTNCPDVEFEETTLDDGDDLYIVLRHRNHVDVISSMNVSEASDGAYTHDFTTESANLLEGFKSAGTPSVISMIAGDLDNNGLVSFADFTDHFRVQYNETNGYYSADFNMDRNASFADFSTFFVPNYNKVDTSAPKIIDTP